MANEQSTGAPLTASVGEQLAEKAHLDEVRGEERKPADVEERRVERKKAEEREAALRHAGAAAEEMAEDAARKTDELADRARSAAGELGAGARRAADQARRATRRAGDALRGERAGRPVWQILALGLGAWVLLSALSRMVRR